MDMKKRVILILIILFITSIQAQDNGNPSSPVDKAYEWLIDKSSNPPVLSSEEIAFSLIALNYHDAVKEEIMNEISKRKIETDEGICFGSESCNLHDTIFLKFSLDMIEEDTEEINDWILSKKEPYSVPGLRWILQIDSDYDKELKCFVIYGEKEKNVDTVFLNPDKTLKVLEGNCVKLYENYWLEVENKNECKYLSIKCKPKEEEETSETFTVSLMYKMNDDNTFYVTDVYQNVNIGERTEVELSLGTYCLKDKKCDYEATLWYVLDESSFGYGANKFVPYLIQEKENNEKYFPEAFLYLVGRENAESVKEKFEKNYFKIKNSKKGKYFDSCLGEMTGILEEKEERKLFRFMNNTINYGDYKSAKDPVRDTAFILWQFFPRETRVRSECEEKGYKCKLSCSEDEINISIKGELGCLPTQFCCKKKEKEDYECEKNGFFCTTKEECKDEILGGKDYECPSGMVCCRSEPNVYECESKGFECIPKEEYCEIPIDLNCPSDHRCCKTKGGGEEENECEKNLGECEEECDEDYETELTDYDDSCNLGEKCCKKFTRAFCSELNGEICDEDEMCLQDGNIIPTVYALDTDSCCLGSCSLPKKTCEELGGELCDESKYDCAYGRTLLASDVSGNIVCCEKGSCTEVPLSCEDKNGMTCADDEICEGGILDEDNCCIAGGRCVNKNNCESLNGQICSENEYCSGDEEETQEGLCCLGECLPIPKETPSPEKKSFLWLIILIIAVAFVCLLFYLFKSGGLKFEKGKLVFGKKPKKPPTTELKPVFPSRPPGFRLVRPAKIMPLKKLKKKQTKKPKEIPESEITKELEKIAKGK